MNKKGNSQSILVVVVKRRYYASVLSSLVIVVHFVLKPVLHKTNNTFDDTLMMNKIVRKR